MYVVSSQNNSTEVHFLPFPERNYVLSKLELKGFLSECNKTNLLPEIILLCCDSARIHELDVCPGLG